MGDRLISGVDGVFLTPLKIIDAPSGDVLHCMKHIDPGYAGFGEAYFSNVEEDVVKGWKRHRQMTLNLIVPVGAIRFVIYDDRPESSIYGTFHDITLSINNYQRLTVPPMVWMAFQGTGESGGILLNIANIAHDHKEVDKKQIDEIKFNW